MEAKKPQSAKITLYRGWLDRGKHVWSPFVIKLEARLRFAGVAYDCEGGSTRTAPKGKIPYVQLGDGQVVGDSTLIIKDLVKRDILPDLNGRVGKEGRARDLALRAMVEEKLYFYHVCCLFIYLFFPLVYFLHPFLYAVQNMETQPISVATQRRKRKEAIT